ncbi:MAG TPA: alpha/beta hydrolase [Terriglobales bacterium]|nr:alpha/beta hydrolase [Terriglobales bacterium]
MAFGQDPKGEAVKRTTDVIYGRKAGMVLTLDVFEPAKKNGAGVIFLVSGGWASSHDDTSMVHVTPENYFPYLLRGYTVFAVVHSSMPRFNVPDIILDVQRAVRFIRHNAADYGVDPNRLGVLGSSSGGHLALMIATQGGPAAVANDDPVDKESSAVQAVACFFPPTDFVNWGGPGVDGVGRGPLSPLFAAFGSLSDTDIGRQVVGKMISPIYYVTAKLPPTLIIHGDADVVVPLQQSESFVAKAKEVGAPPVKLIVRKGKGHGWGDFWKSKEDVDAFADWFDKYIGGK